MKILPVKNFPVGFFAMTMSLFGLALAWKVSGLFTFISHVLAFMAVVVFIVVSVGYAMKFLNYRQDIITEFQHPISMSSFGTISVSIVFLSITISNLFPTLAMILWFTGATLHSMLVIYALGQWLFNQTMSMENLTPACFIPVVGLVIIPVYGATHGFIGISWFFWSLGLLLWIILQVFVLYRLMFVSALPMPLMPSLFILLAPPSVIFINYMNLTNHKVDVFSNAILSFSVLIACLLLSQIKKFKVPFSMQYWAFAFPMLAFSMAIMTMGKTINNNMITYVGYAILFASTILVGRIMRLTLKNIVLQNHN